MRGWSKVLENCRVWKKTLPKIEKFLSSFLLKPIGKRPDSKSKRVFSNYVAINFYDRPKDTLELTRKEGVEQM